MANSVNTIRNFGFNFYNIVRPVNLASMIPKMNIPPLLSIPQILPINLSQIVARHVINTSSLISLSAGLNSISKTIYRA